jgi:hypothetical protein
VRVPNLGHANNTVFRDAPMSAFVARRETLDAERLSAANDAFVSVNPISTRPDAGFVSAADVAGDDPLIDRGKRQGPKRAGSVRRCARQVRTARGGGRLSCPIRYLRVSAAVPAERAAKFL